MTAFVANRLCVGYAGERVIDDLDVQIPRGQTTAIIGANGSGKSTLLKTLGRLLTPTDGHVLLDGVNIAQLPTKTVAQRVGILPQSAQAPDGLTVHELVSQGRYPHARWLRQWSAADARAVTDALAVTGLTAMGQRAVDTLSGGQRQRAWIAMTLAQETTHILLDEPTTFLDIAHQIEVLELLQRLQTHHGRTIVMVLHDINHAIRYSQHLVAMRQGAIVASGAPHAVVSPTLLADVYGVDADIMTDPRTGTPLCVVHGALPAQT